MVNGVTYNPANQSLGMTFNGIAETRQYNSPNQLISVADTATYYPYSAFVNLTYNYPNRLPPTHISHLNVDVELLELSVLRSIDFKSFRPKVIVIEIHGPADQSDWEELEDTTSRFAVVISRPSAVPGRRNSCGLPVTPFSRAFGIAQYSLRRPSSGPVRRRYWRGEPGQVEV